MIVADVFMWVFIILGIVISMPCFWLVMSAVFRGFSGRAESRLKHWPVVSFLVGIVVSVVGIIIVAGVMSAPNAAIKLFGAVIAGVFLTLAMLGTGSFAANIGAYLSSSSQETLWRKQLKGGIVLALSYLFPFAGTFILLPFSIIMGMGAATLAVIGRTPKEEFQDSTEKEEAA